MTIILLEFKHENIKLFYSEPDAVNSVMSKSVGGGAIELSWSPPTEPRGPLTKYIVTYKSTKVNFEVGKK